MKSGPDITEDSLASTPTRSPRPDDTAVVGIARPTAVLHPNDSSESKWAADLVAAQKLLDSDARDVLFLLYQVSHKPLQIEQKGVHSKRFYHGSTSSSEPVGEARPETVWVLIRHAARLARHLNGDWVHQHLENVFRSKSPHLRALDLVLLLQLFFAGCSQTMVKVEET